MEQNTLPFLPTNPQHLSRVTDDCPALFDDTSDAWLTYGELREKIKKAAALLTHTKRCVVLCCIPRSIEGVIAYLAAAHAGHAVIMASPETTTLSELVQSYKPEFVISFNTEINSHYTKEEWPLDSLTLHKTEETFDEPHPDLYLLLLTSGTTGSRKGVRLSHRNMASNTEAIIESLNLTPDHNALGHLPLSYSFGLSVLHTQLAVGGRILLSEESIMSGNLWKIAAEQEVTLFPGVPYQYEMLMRLGIERLNIPTLRVFLQAGGKMSRSMTEQLFEKVKKINKGELHIMYGQTEAAPRISSLPLHTYPEKTDSVGQAMEGSFIIVENDEIIYHGPNVMMGYAAERKDLMRDDEMRGVLRTGDMGDMDEDGFLTITGRKQRFAKLFGQRVALDDLEKIASTYGFAVAAEGKDKIIIFTRNKQAEDHQTIKNDIARQTQLQPSWIEIKTISEIPHKPNGKVDYEKINTLID